MSIIVIGNKPYKNIMLNTIIDSFDENHRCNLGLPNKNNGTKLDNLGLCNHLYENLINKKVNKDKFIDIYKTAYDESYMVEFLDEFNKIKSSYNRIYFASDKKNQYNSLLDSYSSPYKFKLQPRTGYNIVFDNLLINNKVFVTNFSINDDVRVTFYVKEDRYEAECHSKDDEVNIIKWLHNNNKIDATLCMLKDYSELTLDCSDMKPSHTIIKKLLLNYTYCKLENYNRELSNLTNDEFLNKLDEFVIKHNNKDIYIYNKNYNKN